MVHLRHVALAQLFAFIALGCVYWALVSRIPTQSHDWSILDGTANVAPRPEPSHEPSSILETTVHIHICHDIAM